MAEEQVKLAPVKREPKIVTVDGVKLVLGANGRTLHDAAAIARMTANLDKVIAREQAAKAAIDPAKLAERARAIHDKRAAELAAAKAKLIELAGQIG